MKHYLSILFLFFLLLLVACDPAAELGTPFHKGQEVVLTAAIGEQRPQMMPQKYPNPQRISGKDAGEQINLLWDEGDQIEVTVGTHTSVFTLVAGASTAKASFMGTMPASGSSYTVSYPVDYSDELLQQQTYTPNGIAKGLMKMSTSSPGTIDEGFTLSAQHAVLGLQLTGSSEIGKIVLSKNDADGQAASPSYTLLCPKVTLTETATLFYIVLPVGTWANGFTVEVYGADNTTIIDSFVTQNSFTFTAANATTMAAKEVHDAPKRIGVFSVGAGKQVSFSQGNLQYIQSTDTWQFAREQYELIGEDYTTLGIWDLFGWSGKDNNAPFGVSESANVVDYRGEFVDWGINRIGNDDPATWRTLSRDEWQYLIEIRPKADELYGVAMVAGVQGMILLPDDWVCPEGIVFNHGCHSKDNAENFAKHQTFTKEQWNTMEDAGAIFLPAAGIIYPPSKTITSRAGGAHYFSSDQQDEDNAIWFGFRSSYYTINASANHIRRSVRLVHDSVIPEYVDLGLSVKWATFNVGATSPEDYGDYFAWGETEQKEEYSWATYKWCDGTDANITKYNTSDGKITLELEDDAAHVNWGSNWRMPSNEELTELKDKCTWTWTSLNGVKGYEVTGPSEKNIFLPIGGYMSGASLKNADLRGYYWSSSIDLIHDRFDRVCIVSFELGKASNVYSYRRFGLPIRPVYDDTPQRSRGF